MFQVEHYVSGVDDIPSNWIFEFYLKLPPLLGQSTMISSVFNSQDTNPSMSIYFHDLQHKYRFKDFSTGTGGNGINLVQHLLGLTFRDAYFKILNDYKQYIQNGGEIEFTNASIKGWKLKSYVKRSWNVLDKVYWSPYNIGSKLLNLYNVIPLSVYSMESTMEGSSECFDISDDNMYGYFNKKGELYKIYRPLCKEHKFIKISGVEYIQGSDQLHRKDNLLIGSSLKDIMATRTLSLRVDLVAPDSENSFFSKEVIENFKKRYKFVGTLLDSDQAGVKAMQHYEQYDLPFIYMPMEKDMARIIKRHNKIVVIGDLLPKLTTAIEKYHSLHFINVD